MEYKVGQIAELTKTITDEDVEKFAEVSGDYNPIHFDEKYAKSTQFNGLIVHGAIGVGLISSVLANKLPGPGTILLSQEFKYRAPVRRNDVITSKVEIIEISTKGKITLKVECVNQDGTVVIEGISKVIVM